MEGQEGPRSNLWETINSNVDSMLSGYSSRLELDLNSVEVVASVGSGMFFEAKALKKHFPNARITGYEQDNRLTNTGMNIWRPDDVNVVSGSVGDSLIPENSQDFIIVRNPDVHKGWKKAFDECKKALRDGGYLMVTNYIEREQEEALADLHGLETVIREENPYRLKTDDRVSYDNYVLILKK